ncbi:MAG TPA: hypothetical protein PLR69_11080, partial [Candidatus Limiplasma sp.]|nr:hypothetical protein [Candidatus Limiplasma sp.]
TRIAGGFLSRFAQLPNAHHSGGTVYSGSFLGAGSQSGRRKQYTRWCAHDREALLALGDRRREKALIGWQMKVVRSVRFFCVTMVSGKNDHGISTVNRIAY